MRITQLVVTRAFAGTERYAATVAAALADRGHEVTVIGGDESPMLDLVGDADWKPGGSIPSAARSLARLGRQDIVHAHLTNAEAVAVVEKPRHRGRVISTRHIATPRGQSSMGSTLRPIIERGLDREISISRYVAGVVGLPESSVILNFVPSAPLRWKPSSRSFVVAQRLEPEKATSQVIDAWRAIAVELPEWKLVIAGDGSDRALLERSAERLPRVEFRGRVADVDELWRDAGGLIATRPDEPFGLTVVEAMAAGVPVLAAAGGGHLETVGLVSQDCLFRSVVELSAAMLRLAADERGRAELSARGRLVAASQFGADRHMDSLIELYEATLARDRHQ